MACPGCPATRVALVRHGEVHNPQGILYGRLPRFRLSPRGRAQARAAGAHLAAGGMGAVSAVISSPMLRARQTAAEIVRFQPHLRVRVSRLINEVLTPYQGCPAADTEALCGDLYAGTGPDYEHPADVFERVLKFLKIKSRKYKGKLIIAVTHGDPVAFLAMGSRGRALDPKRKAALQDCGIATGYPSHGSVATFELRATSSPVPELIDYWAP